MSNHTSHNQAYSSLIAEYTDQLNTGSVLLSATDTLLSYFTQYNTSGLTNLLEYSQTKAQNLHYKTHSSADPHLIPVMYHNSPSNNNNILETLLQRPCTPLEHTLLTTFIPNIILITRQVNGSKIALRSTKLPILQDIISSSGGALYALEINILKIKQDEIKKLTDVTMITNQYTELTISTYSNFYSCIVDISNVLTDHHSTHQHQTNTNTPDHTPSVLIQHSYSIDLTLLSSILTQYSLQYKILPGSMLDDINNTCR